MGLQSVAARVYTQVVLVVSARLSRKGVVHLIAYLPALTRSMGALNNCAYIFLSQRTEISVMMFLSWTVFYCSELTWAFHHMELVQSYRISDQDKQGTEQVVY